MHPAPLGISLCYHYFTTFENAVIAHLENKKMLKKLSFFLVILLIEGAALMAVELTGAKLVAPFYGSSLYVWTAVLGITVTGLTLGYYAGGRIAATTLSGTVLKWALAASGFLVMMMPCTAAATRSLTGGLNLIAGICITSLLLLLPPMLCFGMVGPLVVNLADRRLQTDGKIAGTVYFISTAGGIIATFLFGVYLIPVAGLKLCTAVTGISLMLASLIYAAASRFVFNEEPIVQQASGNNDVPGKKTTQKPVMQPDAGAKIKRTVYLYAVLEGATVMAVELMAARMLAPWFGSSLYVWSIVMACTLTGLAFGYFAGGIIPAKYAPLNALRWALLAASVFLLLMHATSQQLTIIMAAMPIKTSAILVSILLIIPPLVFLGMVPTLLIRHVAASTHDAGSVTGNIFTISSASGIVALFVTGFYVIPQYGLTTPSIITGLLVGMVPFANLISRKKYFSLVFIAVIILSFAAKKTTETTDNIDVRYYAEGLLGQVLVADVNKFDTVKQNYRLLLVNRIGEAQIDRKTGMTLWEYPYYVTSLCSKLPEKSNALMLGLGGGQIPNMLNFMKLNVDVVELDQRIVDVAQDYFYLRKDINVMVDDARHYLETTTKKYDVIIIDVFHGDIAPPHMLSLEAFKKAKSLLNKNGFVIVNFFGYLHGDLGKPGRSIYNTMTAAGLKTRILPTTGQESERNSLFVGSVEDQNFSVLRSPLSLYNKVVDIDTIFLKQIPDLAHAEVFTDNKPSLDLMNTRGVISFRASYAELTRGFTKEGIPLFQ